MSSIPSFNIRCPMNFKCFRKIVKPKHTQTVFWLKFENFNWNNHVIKFWKLNFTIQVHTGKWKSISCMCV